MTTKLTKGQKYDTDTLTLTGWTGPHEGLSCWDYFGADGEYLGADDDGVEPLFASDAPIRPVFVSYTDGREESYGSFREAVAALAVTYPDMVAEHDGDLSEGGDRTLVWSDEASSVNDDGARAVAMITWE